MTTKVQTIFRIAKDKNNPFVMLDKRPLEDDRLSWKAKGIWAYLMSKPDDWEVRLEDIVKRAKDGDAAVRSGIDELVEYGYMEKCDPERRQDGTYDRHIWRVYEQPTPSISRKSLNGDQSTSRLSTRGLSTSGKPTRGKSKTTNNELTKNEFTNKKFTKKEELNNQVVVEEPPPENTATSGISDSDYEYMDAFLRNAGVMQPKRSQLLNLPHISLSYIQAFVECEAQKGEGIGLMIHRIEQGDPAPKKKRITYPDPTRKYSRKMITEERY